MKTEIVAKERRKDLDMAKGVGILLVVMAHSTLLPETVLQVIHGFHIPLFFVLSGMLVFLQDKKAVSFCERFYGKAKSIMLPYVLCSIIYIIIQQFVVSFDRYQGAGMSLKELCIATISFDGISVLWFLSALFFGELLFVCLKKYLSDPLLASVCLVLAIFALTGKEYILSLVSAHTLLGLWGIGFLKNLLRSLVCTCFLMFGYLFAKYSKDMPEKTASLMLAVFGVCLMSVSAVCSLFNGPVDLHNLVCHHMGLYFLSAVFGSFGVLFLCKSIAAFKWMGWLSTVGMHSLVIMVTHLDFLYLYYAVKWGYAVAELSSRAKQYVFYVVIILSMVLLESITIYIVKRVKDCLKKVRRQSP